MSDEWQKLSEEMSDEKEKNPNTPLNCQTSEGMN